MLKLIFFFIVLSFVNCTNIFEVELGINYVDLYSQCKQNGGEDICVGADNNKKNCVKESICELFYKVKNVDNFVLRHCVYTLKNNFPEKNFMIGFRLGFQHNSPVLESYAAFQNKSKVKFAQIHYYEEEKIKKHEIKSPSFENSKISFSNNFNDKTECYYFCLEQPFNISLRTKENKFRNINLFSDYVTVSMYSKRNLSSIAYTSTKYYDLINNEEFDKKPQNPITTTQINSDFTTTASSLLEQTTYNFSSLIDEKIPVRDNSDVTIDKKLIVIFAISIVLIAFFLLITLSLYNLLL